MINLSDSKCIIKGSRLDVLSELTSLMHELRDLGFDDEDFLTCMKVSNLTPDQALEAAVNKFKEMVKDTEEQEEQDDVKTEEDTDEEQELGAFDKFMDDWFNKLFH